MAFGRPTEQKRIKNAVLEDQLVRSQILTEERTNQTWEKKWSWLLDEYSALHEKLEDLSKESKFLSDVKGNVKPKDLRTIRPIPESTNHQYGWLPRLPEFCLEKYGDDVDKGAPLPANYFIYKGT